MTNRSRMILRMALLGAPIVLAAQVASAGQESKVALFNGAQENPAVATTASGCATFTIDTATNTLTYHISFGGLTSAETAAHIHRAPPGANGPVVHPLLLGNPKIGVWIYPEAMEADILAGQMYVNIHTTMFPGGEIRGQIVDRVALIDAAQEVPPSGTAGIGYGLFNINTVSNTLSYYIAFSALAGAETAAHIHGFALHGVNAGVQHALPAGSPKIGTWNYNNAFEEAILDGRIYVNIHSTLFGGGEIRGQIVGIVAPMDGRQENPPVATPGHGCALFALDDPANQLSYYSSYANLSGPATASHIHGYAPPGVNAGVLVGIGTANPAIGTWAYPAARETDIFRGLTYVNVHTAANPGGEVRGQIIFPFAPCPADIDCSGSVDFADILAVLGAWGNVGAPEDVDKSGVVDFGDILLILGTWGPCV